MEGVIIIKDNPSMNKKDILSNFITAAEPYLKLLKIEEVRKGFTCKYFKCTIVNKSIFVFQLSFVLEQVLSISYFF